MYSALCFKKVVKDWIIFIYDLYLSSVSALITSALVQTVAALAFIKYKGRKRRKGHCHGAEGTMFWCRSYLCDPQAWGLGSSWQKLASNSTTMSENWGQRASTSLSSRNDQPTNTVTGTANTVSKTLYDIFGHNDSCCFTVLHATLTDNHSKTRVAAPARRTSLVTCLIWSFQTWSDHVDSCGNSLILQKKRKKVFTET